jgi:hypothetical protein
LVEDRDVVKPGVVAAGALFGFVLVPMELSAAAFLAEVTSKRFDLQETK